MKWCRKERETSRLLAMEVFGTALLQVAAARRLRPRLERDDVRCASREFTDTANL